ncbi:hypothetical protein GWI33_009108 [Rhynchophorus ferrugineus]|uniref:Uncharacterized protein n=1 Tax=Rhynchophorus ferrugineus TaxID=354439 RepID=A0A834IBY5_RHYFE|nr:hypothetical protein GWI33_009108 [Rhynchophorus ferrugineus]
MKLMADFNIARFMPQTVITLQIEVCVLGTVRTLKVAVVLDWARFFFTMRLLYAVSDKARPQTDLHLSPIRRSFVCELARRLPRSATKFRRYCHVKFSDLFGN